MERETGIEPATSSLGSCCGISLNAKENVERAFSRHADCHVYGLYEPLFRKDALAAGLDAFVEKSEGAISLVTSIQLELVGVLVLFFTIPAEARGFATGLVYPF